MLQPTHPSGPYQVVSYAIKEIFYTLQGEGARTGRPSVFIRFAGCNLWSGHEEDRATAVCQFCDTEFVGMDGPGGGRFGSAEALAQAARALWPDTHAGSAVPYAVCTGGEPLLQLDAPLVRALHMEGFEIAIETNGTLMPPDGVDWICVSPKANAPFVLTKGHELKLVFPQPALPPEPFLGLTFDHFYLQPMDGPELTANTDAAIQYCLQNPAWKLSVQTHKVLGLP